MEEDRKRLYAKFKMDGKLKIMEQMIISESRSTVDEWRAEEAKQTEPTSDKKEDEPESFQKVGKGFEFFY